MEIKIRKKKEHPLSARHTTPISRQMETDMEECKDLDRTDWNEMIRDFIEAAIKEVKKQRNGAA